MTISDGTTTVELETSPRYVWLDYESWQAIFRFTGDLPPQVDTLRDWLSALTPVSVDGRESTPIIHLCKAWHAEDPKAQYVKLKFLAPSAKVQGGAMS